MVESAGVLTPVTESDAVAILSDIVPELSPAVSRSLLLLLLSLAMVETARGKAVRDNNPGNLMAKFFAKGDPKERSVWSGAYWRPSWWFDHSKDEAMYAGNVPSAFRSYPSARDGWRDYVALLFKPSKSAIIDAATVGDIPGFVAALGKLYSPDYKAAHVKTFDSLFREYSAKGYFADSVQTRSSSKGSGLLALIVILSAGLGGWFVARMKGKR